jgi:hypothetical protein
VTLQGEELSLVPLLEQIETETRYTDPEIPESRSANYYSHHYEGDVLVTEGGNDISGIIKDHDIEVALAKEKASVLHSPHDKWLLAQWRTGPEPGLRNPRLRKAWHEGKVTSLLGDEFRKSFSDVSIPKPHSLSENRVRRR